MRINYANMPLGELKRRIAQVDMARVQIIPANARRDLFQSMRLHAPADVKEICKTLGISSATITRDLYFQIAELINFDIHSHLARHHEIAGTNSLAPRSPRDRQNPAKTNQAFAVLEDLGYRWDETVEMWRAPKPPTQDWG